MRPAKSAFGEIPESRIATPTPVPFGVPPSETWGSPSVSRRVLGLSETGTSTGADPLPDEDEDVELAPPPPPEGIWVVESGASSETAITHGCNASCSTSAQ